MFNNELLRLFPSKRIKAVDGMAVTAEVWEESHEYHRQLLRIHALLQHGDGIIAGMTVIASDPPDGSVYILPGIAMDSIGQIIAVPEPRAFDLGKMSGTLHLVISFDESRPQVLGESAQEDAPRYVHTQYSLQALPDPPATPHVGLARVRRTSATTPITDPADLEHPKMDEIDGRFRRQVGSTNVEPANIAVVTLPGAEDADHGEGLVNMARSMRNDGQPTWVDRNAPLDVDLDEYTLVSLVGRDAVQLDAGQMSTLYSYLQKGGTIFYESCHRTSDEPLPAADSAVLDMLQSFGLSLEPLSAGHPLLTEPNFFAQLPDGFETRGTPAVQVADGVVFSTYDFGCIWRGERRGRNASRSEIRNAFEWGANLVAYARARKTQFQAEG